uniref:Uncharacterized protein n=1 Tax=Anguilla anguilla TaxID=7936 RepID=A0A0E9T9U9_ANGAN
MKTAHSISWL